MSECNLFIIDDKILRHKLKVINEFNKPYDKWTNNEFNERITKTPIDYKDDVKLYSTVEVNFLINKFIKCIEGLLHYEGIYSIKDVKEKYGDDLIDYCDCLIQLSEFVITVKNNKQLMMDKKKLNDLKLLK